MTKSVDQALSLEDLPYVTMEIEVLESGKVMKCVMSDR